MATRIENGKTKLIAGAIYERALGDGSVEHAQCTCTRAKHGKVIGFFQRYNHTSTAAMVENTEECDQWTMLSRPVTVEEIAEMVKASIPKKVAKKAAPKPPKADSDSSAVLEKSSKPKAVRRKRTSVTPDV